MVLGMINALEPESMIDNSGLFSVFAWVGMIVIIAGFSKFTFDFLIYKSSNWVPLITTGVVGIMLINARGMINALNNMVRLALSDEPLFPADSTPTTEPTVSPTITPTPPPIVPSAAPVVTDSGAELPWGILLFSLLILVGLIILIGTIIYVSNKYSKNAKIKKEFTTAWNKLTSIHQGVVMEWASYETDVLKVIENPFMFDMREKMVNDFMKALNKANAIRPTNIKTVSDISPHDTPYEKAVFSLQADFAAMELESKKVSWSNFSAGERKRIQTAKNLFNIALDTATSNNERQVAYKRAIKELEGLLVIPKATILQLEAKQQLFLTSHN